MNMKNVNKIEEEIGTRDSIIIDTCSIGRRTFTRRIYHDGHIVEFDFEANSLDICWSNVTLIGIVSGVIYEKGDIFYKVQLRDDKRNIHGEMIIPENKINGIIKDSLMTVECDFCNLKVYVDPDEDKNGISDKEEKMKGWEKFYCTGRRHHVLNACIKCKESITDTDNNKLCPYDRCVTVSRREKERLEKNGIKLIDKL